MAFSTPKHSVGVRSRAAGKANFKGMPAAMRGGSHGGNPRNEKIPKGTPGSGIKRYIALGQIESARIAAGR